MNADLMHSDVREYRMPSGVISTEGFNEIYYYSADHFVDWPLRDGWLRPHYGYLNPSYIQETLGNEVLVKGTGKYVGSFTKRYSKHLYNKVGVKIPDAALSEIGNIVERNSVDNPAYYVDFTQEFEWTPGDFGDSGSCFWSCRKDARLILKDNGAYAVRFYESLKGRGKGRAWLAPYNGSWIVFNAYGPYQKFEIARVLAHQWGVSYKSMESLTNGGSMDKMLYINSAGVVIAPSEEIETTYKGPIEIELGWSERPQSVRCASCGRVHMRSDSIIDPASGRNVCPTCRSLHYFRCEECNQPTHNNNCNVSPAGRNYCSNCAVSYHSARYCDECMALGWDRVSCGSDFICESCYESSYQSCQDCDRVLRYTNLYNTGEKVICNRCRANYPEHREVRVNAPTGWSIGYGSDATGIMHTWGGGGDPRW